MGTKVVIFSGSRGFWFVLCAGVLLSSLCGQRRKVTKKKAAGYACSLLRSWFWLNVLKLASLGQSHVFYAKTARFVLRSCAEAGFLRGGQHCSLCSLASVAASAFASAGWLVPRFGFDFCFGFGWLVPRFAFGFCFGFGWLVPRFAFGFGFRWLARFSLRLWLRLAR